MSASHRFHLDYEHQTKDPVAPRWMLQALESRANIIRTIKETINDIGASDIESIAVMIAMLICVEASNGNIAEMDTHIAGLQKLIQTFGSIDDFDLSTISFLMGVDILWAIVKCASPALPLAAKYLEYALNQPALTVHYYDHPDGDFSDWQAEKSFHSLGSRFANSSWARLLDRSLRTAIRNFRNLIIHYETDENRQQRERVAAFEDNNPWNISQRFVLSLSYEHLGPGDIREPLRRSMLAYSMTRYCKFGAFPCMDVVAGSLRDSIVPRLDTLLSTAPDLLFWILYAGALTARKSSEHYTWFCTELGGVSSMLDIFCWNDARSLLEQFFFCHRLSDQSAEKTWQDIGSFMAKDLCIRHSKNLGSQDMLSEYK